MSQFDREGEFDFNYFVSILKTIYYYKENYKDHLHHYNVDLDSLHLSGRHRLIFPRFIETIDLFSESEEIFNDLIRELYQCYKNYFGMTHYRDNKDGTKVKINDQQKLIVEEV